MNLKTVVKFTNGTRHQLKIKKNLLSKYNNIIKYIKLSKFKNGGRNNTGRITVRHRGNGCKKKVYNFIDQKTVLAAVLINVMYNSKTNNFTSLYFNLQQKCFFTTTAIKSMYPGCIIELNKSITEFKLGNRANIKSLPTGTLISSIQKKKKIVFSKAAGCFSQIIEKKSNIAKIKVSSGKIISIPINSFATLGPIGNDVNNLTVVGKAGRNRLKGWRPSVRGVAMNPVDHPHGGKSNKGMPQVTPWGIPTKNKKTRKKRHYE
jgi:large subunit ribosomal protein L2